jgi:hypothetical protein
MSEFNNTESNIDAFWYDKNEFYAEYGLSKGAKRDNKSRSMKEREKAEKRNKKTENFTDTLPTKTQKKMDDLVGSLPSKIQKKMARLMSTLPSKVAEIKTEVGKPKKLTNYVSMKNTRENVAYNEDEDDNDYSDYDEPETQEETDDEEFQEETDDDEDDEEYKFGLSMWLSYGLTKKQYDADLEHRANIAALNAFEEDPENYHALEYGNMLRQKIKKFEDEIEAQHKALYPDDECIYPVYEDEDDIAERYRENRMESAIENARDDMRED